MIAPSLLALRRRLQRSRSRDGRTTLKERNLARRLSTTFEQDLEMAGIQGIHFYIQHGVVTLYGTVRSELDRDLLLSLVRQVPGVKGVVEHLQIVAPRFQDTTP